MIRKVIRDGKVAVILAKCVDEGGWYTEHNNLQLLFLPELVELIENVNSDYFDTMECILSNAGYNIDELYINNLTVEWVDVNEIFTIDSVAILDGEYFDEVIQYKRYFTWINALEK